MEMEFVGSSEVTAETCLVHIRLGDDEKDIFASEVGRRRKDAVLSLSTAHSSLVQHHQVIKQSH